MDKKEIVQKSSSVLRDYVRETIDRHYEKEITDAVARQKEEDVCCAIAAFLDLKTSETEIMHLLNKHFGVDSISKATELITTVKVKNQADALREHLNGLGLSRVEAVNYLREHNVRKCLMTDSKLQNMTIDKLKEYFDKH